MSPYIFLGGFLILRKTNLSSLSSQLGQQIFGCPPQISITPCEFFASALIGGLSAELSVSKFPQVSRTLPSIRTVINYAVILLFFILPLISNFSSLFPSLWIPFQVHQLQLVSPSSSSSTDFCFLARSKYFSIFMLSFMFTLWSAGIAKSRDVKFFFFCWLNLVWFSTWD